MAAHATADEAVAAIEALQTFNLAIVEQPTRRDRLAALAEVKRARTRRHADESVFTPDDLDEAIELDAFDILSVYPGKNGGFSHSLAMAKKAQAAGEALRDWLELETDLGQAAHLALASSLSAFPVDRYACDLMGSLFYAESAVTPAIELKQGRVTVPTGLGFGVQPRD